MKTPPRQIGRVPEEIWTQLKSHAKAQGLAFSTWAVLALVEKMRVERMEEKRRKERKER